MKTSVAWLGAFIGLFCFVQPSQQQAELATLVTPEMIGTVLDGADKLVDLIKKIDDTFLKPVTDKVNQEINKIDTDLDGLDAEEKQFIVDAKKKLLKGRSDIYRMRTILNVLADETMQRSKTLIKVITATLDGKITSELQKKGVEMVLKKMRDLMSRSVVLLQEAKTLYREVGQALGECQIDLEEFAKRVSILADRSTARYEAEAKALRMKAYISLTSCVLLPPVCAIGYPIAAGVVESLINKWEERLDNLVERCHKSEANAKEMVDKVKRDVDLLQTEEELIVLWESKMNAAYVDVKENDYLETVVTMEMLLKEGYHVNQLQELIVACQAYKKHSAIALG